MRNDNKLFHWGLRNHNTSLASLPIVQWQLTKRRPNLCLSQTWLCDRFYLPTIPWESLSSASNTQKRKRLFKHSFKQCQWSESQSYWVLCMKQRIKKVVREGGNAVDYVSKHIFFISRIYFSSYLCLFIFHCSVFLSHPALIESSIILEPVSSSMSVGIVTSSCVKSFQHIC